MIRSCRAGFTLVDVMVAVFLVSLLGLALMQNGVDSSRALGPQRTELALRQLAMDFTDRMAVGEARDLVVAAFDAVGDRSVEANGAATVSIPRVEARI